ncbi:uncharacterized protein EKO05_0006020 [Ascochyta rabiei]|uniref:uncharacterized protein n=1 Tax=Didymella rabiei TaxID=5454 RepID=UPI00220F9F07|nr:uncharacterized protein EKO05_0006020 [Ascochyta rabiei]UPX15576.1 hypothetical protein EKO05_0006020 [Ascochyta rabiei]
MTFKLIISGVTGRIGRQVLHHALQNPTITSVIALSRRASPDLVQHAKVLVLVLQDFTVYPEDVVAELAGADGCIWCMTTTAGDPVLEIDYPRAFANAITPSLANHGKPFRYLHLSGGLVERDQKKFLWMKGSVRKTKGQGETQMIGIANEPSHCGLWETIIARPGMVVQKGSYVGEASMWLAGSSGSCIRSDELALALIDAVLHGSEQLLLPATLLRRGQELAKLAGLD